jgi:mannosyltransferase
MDEIAEIRIASLPIHSVVLSHDGFPPLYFLLAHLWLGTFSDPASLRVLSVIFGTLMILAAWQLGRLAGGELAGLLAAFLLAVSPLHIYISQEARPYSLYFLLAVLGIWLFYRARASDQVKDWAVYASVAVLGLYTHYYFAILILTFLLTILWGPRSWIRERRMVMAHMSIVALAVPCLLLLQGDLGLQQGYTLERPDIGLTTIGYAGFTFLAGFGIGPSPRELHAVNASDAIRELLPWILVLGISALYLIVKALRSPTDRLWALRLGVLVAFPVVLCAILGAVLGVGFRVRYVVWCAAPVLVLLALGAAPGLRSWRTSLSLAVLVGVSLLSNLNRWTQARYMNEDVRGAARYLASARDGSIPIFVVADYMAEPLGYYTGRGSKVFALRGPVSGDPSRALEQLRNAVSPGQPFWLVYTRAFDGDSEGRLLRVLRVQAVLTHRAALAGIEIYKARGF